ncbi:phenylalanine--tRNA ligase subunit beta, partial [Candidatus Microgenomates bacterium]|nr:phenylalanine--tRNA ligase subunit beta [Candidatus Microgenomates bacterium]
MNILVPDSWLREHLKTKAAVKQIAKYLSLCSQSIEKVTKKDNDWIYEIEITTNRPDCLAIYGIARELAAILPRFGIKAKLQPLELIEKIKPERSIKLDVKIAKASLCPRFTALIFNNIIVKPSPKIVRDRLEKCGIRALNNVVDISNYLMLELNQPMHTFDYDKIKKAKMILRESRSGEKITTLDGTTRDLPEKSMIIEDGSGRIIDLCGTMGGKNSAVDENTKRVLLFVQTYDPIKIRQECQRLAFHTEASLRFEKGVEPEGVMPAMKKAIPLFEKNCGARVASNLIDIYPNPSKSKTVKISLRLIEQQLGVKIPPKEVIEILESLGFKILSRNSETVSVKVPSWRANDISIPEDLVEEVARIYGYHQLPSLLPTGDFPEPVLIKTFYWENKIKDALKNWGFTEIYSYSMQSKNLIKKTGLSPEKCLKIKNPLTKDLEYMRTSLISSILQTLAENQKNYEKMKIFELANIYLPRKNKLPEEKPILIGALTGNKFYEAKGIIEALLNELGIKEYQVSSIQSLVSNPWHPTRTALIIKNKELPGIVGEIHPKILTNFGIKKGITVFNLDIAQLFEMATMEKTY